MVAIDSGSFGTVGLTLTQLCVADEVVTIDVDRGGDAADDPAPDHCTVLKLHAIGGADSLEADEKTARGRISEDHD